MALTGTHLTTRTTRRRNLIFRKACGTTARRMAYLPRAAVAQAFTSRSLPGKLAWVCPRTVCATCRIYRCPPRRIMTRIWFTSGGSAVGMFGGTSVGAPVFAGVAGFLNQVSFRRTDFRRRQGSGSLNPRLYAMAQAAPKAFHDVTGGDKWCSLCASNRVPCTLRCRSDSVRARDFMTRQRG